MRTLRDRIVDAYDAILQLHAGAMIFRDLRVVGVLKVDETVATRSTSFGVDDDLHALDGTELREDLHDLVTRRVHMQTEDAQTAAFLRIFLCDEKTNSRARVKPAEAGRKSEVLRHLPVDDDLTSPDCDCPIGAGDRWHDGGPDCTTFSHVDMVTGNVFGLLLLSIIVCVLGLCFHFGAASSYSHDFPCCTFHICVSTFSTLRTFSFYVSFLACGFVLSTRNVRFWFFGVRFSMFNLFPMFT